MFLIIKQPFLNRKYHLCNKGQFSSRNFTWFFVRKFAFRVSTWEIPAKMINFEQKSRILNQFFRFWSKNDHFWTGNIIFVRKANLKVEISRVFSEPWIEKFRTKILNSKPIFQFWSKMSKKLQNWVSSKWI